MDRVFGIEELRRYIVAMAASKSPWDREARRTLSSLARVSKSLSDIALDALWDNMDEVTPFLKLLPRDAVDENSSGYVNLIVGTAHLPGSKTSSEMFWNRRWLGH